MRVLSVPPTKRKRNVSGRKTKQDQGKKGVNPDTTDKRSCAQDPSYLEFRVLSLVKGMEWNWKRESKDEAHAELRSNVSK
jgi:hypothetical protein